MSLILFSPVGRIGPITQTLLKKNSFVFQINHVFDHLEVTRHHTGPVLFIEEDHYLVEDFIYVLNRMFKYAQE